MNDEQIADVISDHYPNNPTDHGDFTSKPRCVECGQIAPCDARLVAQALEQARAELDRIRGHLEDAYAQSDAAQQRLDAESARVARVEGVRARIMDSRQFLVEGPMIGRIAVTAWLDTALAEPQQVPPHWPARAATDQHGTVQWTDSLG